MAGLVSREVTAMPGSRMWLRIPSSRAGHLLAALAFSASVTPSLYPRPWLVQGLLSGSAAAVGYAVGRALTALWRAVMRRPPSTPAAGRKLVALAVLAAVGSALLLNALWQVDVRRLMGTAGGAVWYPVPVLLVALLSGYVLIVLGRMARAAHRRYVGLLARRLPRAGRVVVRVVLTFALVVVLVDVVIAGWAFSAVNRALVAGDAHVDAEVAPPTSTYRSGGPGSLLPWETLGSRGRAFVTEGPTRAQLSAFNAAPAATPIRVYVGLTSAGSHRERAALAVSELERTGAFQRDVLMVVIPTGSGGVNPYAVDPLEYSHNGNTAAVAVQYSYLPSWVVMAGDQEEAKRGARALFEAVATRVAQESPADRPQLLLYGESLGSFGAEAVFEGLHDLRRRADGALFVGPPRANRLWQELTAERDVGSPLWQPVYRGGAHVRFGWDGASLLRPGGDWAAPRVAYLQHASDPITWWTPALIWERPEWLDEPRGHDVSAAMPYLPVVTFLQVTIDMLLGAGAPVEHGHIYGPAQAEAWALIAAPESWSLEDTQRLLAVLTP